MCRYSHTPLETTLGETPGIPVCCEFMFEVSGLSGVAYRIRHVYQIIMVHSWYRMYIAIDAHDKDKILSQPMKDLVETSIAEIL